MLLKNIGFHSRYIPLQPSLFFFCALFFVPLPSRLFAYIANISLRVCSAISQEQRDIDV